MIMLVSSGLVGAMNLVYNLAIAHGLGAASFGHASAVYTLLMLLSSVTLSFQLLCSKFVAKTDYLPVKVGIYRFLHRRAWMFGIGISLLLVLASPILSAYLNLPTRNYILMLAAGTIFFIPLGVFAYLVAKPGRELSTDAQAGVPATLEEGVQAIVFFVGQVIINNLDIILVKHFFSATQAGVYATIALVGRVVYMLSWSVVSSMFPFSARARSHERDGRAVLSTALLLVVLITSLFTLAVWLAPSSLWHSVLGDGFPLGGQSPYSSLLVLYAATTGIYSLGVVLMSYEISRKIGNVGWLQLCFSGAIVGGIYLFHNTLQEVITVQLVVMMLLLLAVSVPFFRAQREVLSPQPEVGIPLADAFPSAGAMRKVRRVSEDEVISEFLKSEFYQPEFDRYREQFREIVTHPDLSNPAENELRRALLYRRRGRMWRELPVDTEWWQVELRTSDLARIRVFPRNHWRKLANGNFYLTEMVDHIRARVGSHPSDTFVAKLRSLSDELASAPEHDSSVLLIGLDEEGPLTIIEGNHRMAAASLVSPQDIHLRFQFLCGFSPRMIECCWYQTDLSTLWRYARNFVAYLFEDPDLAIEQASQTRLSSDTGVGLSS